MDGDQIRAQADELKELRERLAECLRREEAERSRKDEADRRHSDLRRQFSEAKREYSISKTKHGLHADQTLDAQRKLLELTVKMLRATQGHVRGLHITALGVAAMALEDGLEGTPWISLSKRGPGYVNLSPFRRKRVINYGLAFVAAARAGQVEVVAGPRQTIDAAAKAIVAEKLGVTEKSVTRWWNDAKKAGIIEDITPSFEEFLNRSGHVGDEDVRSAKQYLREHLIAVMEGCADDMRKGAGH